MQIIRTRAEQQKCYRQALEVQKSYFSDVHDFKDGTYNLSYFLNDTSLHDYYLNIWNYDGALGVYLRGPSIDGTEEERNSAIQTLYTALEAALTLIHPFMPFITEEMWQRMPRRPEDDTKSIMVAKYPQYNALLDDPEAETAYELVLGCTKAARSLMAEYSLKTDAEG